MRTTFLKSELNSYNAIIFNRIVDVSFGWSVHHKRKYYQGRDCPCGAFWVFDCVCGSFCGNCCPLGLDWMLPGNFAGGFAAH